MSNAAMACPRRSATVSSSTSSIPASTRTNRRPAARARSAPRSATGFDAPVCLASLGIARRAGERVVSLFCYDNPAVPALLDQLRHSRRCCSPRLATQRAIARRARRHASATVRAIELAHLPRSQLIRSPAGACDLNLVRGEDSAVRAMWAGAPFVWQFYRRTTAHTRQTRSLSEPLFPRVANGFWRAWNSLGSQPDRIDRSLALAQRGALARRCPAPRPIWFDPTHRFAVGKR